MTNLVTKTLHAVEAGATHVWVEIEHLGDKVVAAVKNVTIVKDIGSELAALKSDAEAKRQAAIDAINAYHQALTAAGSTASPLAHPEATPPAASTTP